MALNPEDQTSVARIDNAELIRLIVHVEPNPCALLVETPLVQTPETLLVVTET